MSRVHDCAPVVDGLWREVQTVVRTGRHLSRRRTNPLTVALCELVQHRGDRTRGHGQQQDPDLIRALEIYEAAQTKRSQMEAYLLTELDCLAISERLQERPRVIELYEACFFSVRGLSRQQMSEVISSYASAPADKRIELYAWKNVAVTGGAPALDELCAVRPATSLGEMAAQATDEAISITRIAMADQLKSACSSGSKQMALLQQLRDMDPQAGNRELDYLHAQIDAIIKSIQFCVGPPKDDQASPELVRFAHSACELNYVEQMRAGFGLEINNADQLLQMRYPVGPDDLSALGIPSSLHSVDQPGPDAELATDGPTIPCPAADIPSGSAPSSPAGRPSRSRSRHRQRVRDQPPALPAVPPAESPEELRNRVLDQEWKQLTQRLSGRSLNAAWLEFRRLHPDYIQREARKRLAEFAPAPRRNKGKKS